MTATAFSISPSSTIQMPERDYCRLMESAEVPSFEFHIPPELASGAYANILGVWHTGHEFTLDFSVTMPPQADEEGETSIPAHVVARIKISPSLVFDILQTLNQNMTQYEENYGEIQRPGEGP